MSKAQTLGRNMGLRIVMLESAPGWSIRQAQGLAEMSATMWSRYRCGRSYSVTERALERIGLALGMRTADLLGTPGRVIATSIPAQWLPLSEDAPQPTEDVPE